MSAIRGFRVSWDILYKYGHWAKPVETRFQRGRRLFLTSLLIPTAYVFCALVADVAGSFSNMARFTFILCMLSTYIIFVVRYYFLQVKLTQIKAFIQNCEDYYAERDSNGGFNLKLFEARANLVVRVLRTLIPFMVVSLVGYMVGPLLEGKRDFPTPARYFQVMYETPFYECWYAFTVLLLSWVVPSVVFSEFVMAGFMLQLSAHYELLIDKIRSSDVLMRGWIPSNSTKPLKELLAEEVKLVAREHQYILSQINLLNNIYSTNMLVDVCICTIMLIGLGYDFGVALSEITMMTIAEACYGCVVITDLTIQCTLAQQIENKSLELADTLWGCNWLEMDKPTQINTKIIIGKAQRPVMLSLGKFAPACSNTMVTVFRAAMNVVLVLRELSTM